MASLTAVRAAVKTTLEAAIPSLRVYDKVPGIAQVPAAVVEPVTADFLVAMGRGTDTWQFNLHVLVADAEESLGQAQLDEYVSGAGTKSIRAAVFAARTLGLSNTDAHIAAVTAYGGQFESADIAHIGATLRLVVHTKGSE
ncbi:hypothetical protein [Actinoplanes sp. NPDC049118]|uniref:hypothetical protein n=1 Tax=Actinoplanes sp. NPDC049118 TaxID=3155769 RepID=UPI0033D7945F